MSVVESVDMIRMYITVSRTGHLANVFLKTVSVLVSVIMLKYVV